MIIHKTYNTIKDKHGVPIMNIIMIIFSIKMLFDIIKRGLYALQNDVNEKIWDLSELLINYQGGFVRRGLLGDIIYHFSGITGINPLWIVGVICVICFAFVIYSFIHLFRLNNIRWWILPLSIFLANNALIRKDYLFITTLIIMLYLYRSELSTLTKFFLINLLGVITILCHEAFFFVCVPLFSLIVLVDKNNISSFPIRLVYCLPMYISMAIVCLFHGDLSTAQEIQQSWVGIVPNWDANLPFDSGCSYYGGSIGALAWTTDFAIRHHIKLNFIDTSLYLPGYIIRLLAIILIFYFVINYLRFFSSKETSSRIPVFFNIFFFQFLSLLPLFTVLSCDTMRICFYWLTSSFAFFLILPDEKTFTIFPNCYIRLISKLNYIAQRLLPSNKTITFILIFFICAPYIGNNIPMAFMSCVLIQYFRLFIICLSVL